MKLAGLVVLYNPSKQIIENLNNYLQFVNKLYVIDNSEKPFFNKQLFSNSNIDFYYKNENLGIAKALNIGCKKAIEDGFKWLLTMDQDSIFNINTVNQLCDYIENNDVSKTYIVSPWLNTKLLDEKPVEKISHPTDVMTSGSIMNLDLYKKIGGFKEWLFIDGVDIEYCLRLKKYNYKVMRLNKFSIKHNLGNISYKHFLKKELLCLNHNYLRVYYRVRNYNYIKQEYHDIAPEFCNILVKIKALVWCIIFYENDKIRKLKSIYYAKKDFKNNIYGKYNH